MLESFEDRTPAAFNVVLNWFDELEQLVPIEDQDVGTMSRSEKGLED